MKPFLSLTLTILLSLVLLSHSFPEEYREEQRSFWRNPNIVQRETITPAPDFVSFWQPSDASAAHPIEMGNIHRNKRKFTDQYAMHGSLSYIDPEDTYVLRYNHTAANNRSTAEPLISTLWIAASDQTADVEVTWALFGASSLPTSIDGTKAVSELQVRLRVPGLPSGLRMLASAKMDTSNMVPGNSMEQKIKFYYPAGYDSSCSGFPNLPISFANPSCNYTNAIKANKNLIALPPTGEFWLTVYSKFRRPVPYVLTFGFHSLLNYVPLKIPAMGIDYIPSGEFATTNTEDQYMLARVYQGHMDVGSNVEFGADVQNGYYDFVPADPPAFPPF
jgi:hypothetical protein